MEVHGIDSEVYNILSDSTVNINARFVFLNHGECPILNGARLTNCYSHPGSYFGALSIWNNNYRLLITAGDHNHGFTSVIYNDKVVAINETIYTGNDDQQQSSSDHIQVTPIHIKLISTHSLMVRVSIYEMVIENSDMFLNLKNVDVSCWSCLVDQLKPTGLLGRTWNRHLNINPRMSWDEVDTYAERQRDMFGADFEYIRRSSS